MLWFPVCRNFYVCTILWGNGARAAKASGLLLYGGNLPKLGEFPNIGLRLERCIGIIASLDRLLTTIGKHR